MIVLRRQDIFAILALTELDFITAGSLWCEVRNTPGLIEFLDDKKFPYSIV